MKLEIFILTFLKIFDIINIENKKGRENMFINVQFKNRKKEFVGRIYSYELASDAEPPKKDAIVRLTNENYDYINYGTRVRVDSITDVPVGRVAEYLRVRYVESSMDE